MVKFEDVKNVTTEEYFKNNGYAVDMFKSKYSHTKETGEKETPAEVFWRISTELSKFENDKNISDTWFDFMWNDWFRPGGSVITGIGSGKKISLANCTTVPVEGDSLEDISKAEYTLMKCAAYRQGIGIDLSKLRPRGSKLGNAAEESTGVVPWGEKFSSVGNYVGQCLDGDVKIETNKGRVSIKEINEKDSLYAKTHMGYKKINKLFKNGKKRLYKLISEDGGEIVSTKEHRFVIYDTIDEKFKLVKMKDIVDTDLLVKSVK